MAYGSIVFAKKDFATGVEIYNGATVGGSFYYESGSYPPYGATFVSAVLRFEGINVYLDSYIDFGDYGNFDMPTQSSGGNPLSGRLYNLLNFSDGSSLRGTVCTEKSYSGRVLNFRNKTATLTITYSYSTNVQGQLDKLNPKQNETVTLSFSKENPSYKAIVTWTSSSGQTVQQNIGTATSASFTIPSNWATGVAKCKLELLTADEAWLSDTIFNFDVQLDTSVITPSTGNFYVSLIQSNYVPSNWNVYVKGLSKAQLSVPNAAAGNNASIQSIDFTCGTQMHSSASDKTWITEVITETGILACDVSVVNNYGNSADGTTQEITVYDYSDPQFTTVLAFRCLQNGTPSDSGAYISVQVDVSFASVGGNNSLITFAVQYKKTTDSSWSTAVSITSSGIVIIGGDLSNGFYQIRVVAVDQIQNLKGTYTERIESVMTSDYVIHCLDGGFNVSIGMQGTVPMAFQLNPNWKFMHGNREIDLGTRELDELPTPGSQNTVKSGGMYTAIQALLPTPLNLSIAPSAWTYSGDKYVYEHQADVTAKTTIIGNFTDEIGAQSIKSGILITPSAGRIIFQTDLLPTDTVNLGLLLQDIYENASPFFLHKGKGGDTPYDAITQFVVSQQVTNPVENVNMVMLMPNGYVAAILDVLWSTYSSVKVAAIPHGFRPGSTQSISTKYYSSASGGISGYDTTVTINPFGDVQVSSVSPSYYYGISKMFAYYQKSDQEETYSAFEIVSGGYLDGATIITNRITKAGNMVKYEIEATFDTPQTFVGSSDIGIHIPAEFLPSTSPLYPTGYVIYVNSTAETSRGMRMIRSTDYGYVWFESYAADVVYFRMEYATTAQST